jgi:hypothetical protein
MKTICKACWYFNCGLGVSLLVGLPIAIVVVTAVNFGVIAGVIAGIVMAMFYGGVVYDLHYKDK